MTGRLCWPQNLKFANTFYFICWDSYGGSDVSGPASVARHRDEASAYYNMPIDGDVWLDDPLDSSYPPSIAFKAAQLQDEKNALAFLRRIREMVFLEKKNITKWDHLSIAAEQSGLDVQQLKADFEGRAEGLFEEDLTMARALGVRGFPTIFFTDEAGNRLLVYGSKAYEKYEEALLKLFPGAKRQAVNTDPEWLFDRFPTLTTTEFAALTGKNGEAVLEELYVNKVIGKFSSKNGVLWINKR